MKKIIALSVVFALFSVAAFSQKGKSILERERIHNGFRTGELTRAEKMKLKKNDIQYRKAYRRYAKDGHLSRGEKRKLYAIKKHDRRETFRFRHNDRKRII